MSVYCFSCFVCVSSTHINLLRWLYAVYGHNRQKRKRKKTLQMKFFQLYFVKAVSKMYFSTLLQWCKRGHGLPSNTNQIRLFFLCFFKISNEYIFLLFQLYYCSSIINFKIKLWYFSVLYCLITLIRGSFEGAQGWSVIHYIAKSIGSPPSNEQVWLL